MENKFPWGDIVNCVVTLGVGKVIDDAIDATAPETVKPLAKILRKIGAWSLGWAIGDLVGQKVEEEILGSAAKLKELSDKVDEASEQVEGQEDIFDEMETEE